MDEKNEKLILEKINGVLRKVIDKQIYESNPPETAETMERLVTQGFSEDKAYELIGRVVSEQLAEVLERTDEFSMENYIKALERLPDPFVKWKN